MGRRWLAFSVAFGVVSVGVLLGQSSADAGPVARVAGKVLSAERLIRQCANPHRAAAGLPTLQPNVALDRAARLHSRRMRWKGFFDHVDDRGWGPEERVDVLRPAGRWERTSPAAIAR